MATKMVLACSHSRSLQLLARLAARTEFEILEHSLKGGGPLASAARFQIRYAHPISPDCHQLYTVIVAKPYAWLQKPEAVRNRPSSAVSWSLLNIVRFPPVWYCQISSAIAETALYSRFSGHNGGVVKGEKRKRTSLKEFNSPSQLRQFPRATKKGPCV